MEINKINFKNTFKQKNIDPRSAIKKRPVDFVSREEESDKLRKSDLITKTKVNIENAINTPGYAYRGLKGDPDFNFFEYLKVSKIPYYLGGITLAGVVLGSKNGKNAHASAETNNMFKKVLAGVVMYYLGRELANTVIDVPVKWFRGLDLNHPYKNVTALREGNPLNLPNNKKKCNQKVFESVEFTRWDLLYKHDGKNPTNTEFDRLAKKFGAKRYDTDSDSKVKGKIKELIIMANSWKYMLTVPFVTLGLGLANQDAFEKINLKGLWNSTTDFLKPSKYAKCQNWSDKVSSFKATFTEGFCKPIRDSFVSLWKGHNKTSKIFGKTAIISAIALPIIANALILYKSAIKSSDNSKSGGEN